MTERKAGFSVFFFQAEDGIRDLTVTGVQTCALPIFSDIRLEGLPAWMGFEEGLDQLVDRKSTRLNSSHSQISYAVFCLKKKTVPASEASYPAGTLSIVVLLTPFRPTIPTATTSYRPR